MSDDRSSKVVFEGRNGKREVAAADPKAPRPGRQPMRQMIKVSPALLAWIQRAPSPKIAAHRERWAAQPTDVDAATDGEADDAAS